MWCSGILKFKVFVLESITKPMNTTHRLSNVMTLWRTAWKFQNLLGVFGVLSFSCYRGWKIMCKFSLLNVWCRFRTLCLLTDDRSCILKLVLAWGLTYSESLDICESNFGTVKHTWIPKCFPSFLKGNKGTHLLEGSKDLFIDVGPKISNNRFYMFLDYFNNTWRNLENNSIDVPSCDAHVLIYSCFEGL